MSPRLRRSALLVGVIVALSAASCGDPHDVDGDGYVQDDCDPDDPSIHPDGVEVPYDGVDQDCAGGDLIDADGDGFVGVRAGGDDCDDADAAIHPGAIEIPANAVDEDCSDGDLRDRDGDGFDGSESGGPDCDDTDASVYPGAEELPDHVDNNCSGRVDEGTPLFDDDGDGYSESQGDCNDYNAALNPGADEIAGDHLDNNCDGRVDELTLAALPSAAVDALMAASASGPIGSTPGDMVYLHPGFASVRVRYVVRDAGGAVTEVLDAPAHRLFPARFGFPAAIVRAYSFADGRYGWGVDGSPPPAGGVPFAEVQVVDRVPFLTPPPAAATIERYYVSMDPMGHEVTQRGPTLSVQGAPVGAITSSVALLDLRETSGGPNVHSLDLPLFGEGDMLLFAYQTAVDQPRDDDWAYECLPIPRAAGGITIQCTTRRWEAVGPQMGKLIQVHTWHAPPPFRVRCVSEDGAASTCAVPPTIRVANDEQWTAFVECPFGYRCMTVAVPVADWGAADDDQGYSLEVQPIDPLRDLGVPGIVDMSTQTGGGLPLGYVAGMRGDVVEVKVHGGNGEGFVRFVISQLMVPVGMPVAAESRTVRWINRDGSEFFSEESAACYPSAPLVAPVLTTYDPHFEQGPSLLSRIGHAVKAGLSAGVAAYDVYQRPGIDTGIALVKKVYNLVLSIFSLGAPQEDDGQVTEFSLLVNQANPSCVDVATRVPHVSSSTPAMEHAVTVYSVFEQP